MARRRKPQQTVTLRSSQSKVPIVESLQSVIAANSNSQRAQAELQGISPSRLEFSSRMPDNVACEQCYRDIGRHVCDNNAVPRT